jgi:hypothetical protein
MIIALAGRRIDTVDAETPRFPLEMKDVVLDRLVDLFERLKPSALVSSAACGADLLGLEAAGDLGITRYIILPFGRDAFLETSVIDRPGGWGSRFKEIIRSVDDDGNLIILDGSVDDTTAYSRVTTEILERAEQLASGNKDVIAVAVWEGQAKGEDDETAAFVAQATERDIEVEPILTT